ncbi:MAG: branched-chain amino acid ABC transporter permease [Desulfobulbaceae bacterium]|nr:branched-chain amino acid ABC transporter permease [Desulfobulbaceae bacterium]
MTTQKRSVLALAVGTLFLFALPPVAQFFDQIYLVSLISRVLIYALAAVSLDLLLGYGGLISLGHAAYVGIGAYVVGVCFFHASEMEPLIQWPVEIAGSENALIVLPLAALVSALFALVFGAMSLRTKGMHFIMITLAFAQMLYYLFVSLEKYGGSDGLSLYSRSTIPGFDLGSDVEFYYLCLTLLCLFLIFAERLVRSRFGLIVRGAKDNPRRIQALGIHTFRYQLVLFMIAGAGAGLAGALLANQTEYVSPGLLHWTLSGELMVMVILGGLGTLYGPVLGAAAFLLMEENLAMYTEHWMVYMGPFLLLVVLFARNGLWGLLVGKGDHE